jgi:hypothetical protein
MGITGVSLIVVDVHGKQTLSLGGVEFRYDRAANIVTIVGPPQPWFGKKLPGTRSTIPLGIFLRHLGVTCDDVERAIREYEDEETMRALANHEEG